MVPVYVETTISTAGSLNMYEVQSNTGGYDRPAELSFSTLQQTAGSGVSHSGRDVAVIFPPTVSPLAPPPSYSELFHIPPPSYQEVMGLEHDIESAEEPPTPPHQEVEAANYTLFRRWRWHEPWTSRRCVIVVASPILALSMGACCWYISAALRASPS